MWVAKSQTQMAREYAADLKGAELCGNPLFLASALEKISGGLNSVPMRDSNPSTAHLFIMNPLQGKGFAADMVRATALEIRDESLAKAAQKLEVVAGLEKMAKDSYAEGDRLTGDVISATIQNIKKG